jgi:hypothetical protein
VCQVSVAPVEPSDLLQNSAIGAADVALLKLKRAKAALEDATASLAALDEQPFPWKEAKNDEGITYFYDESSEESVFKLPPEDAAIYNEKKRLVKIIQTAQKQLESAGKVLGKTVQDELGVARNDERKSKSKLPSHLQKTKQKVKSNAVSAQDGAENAGDGNVDAGDGKRLQKVNR